MRTKRGYFTSEFQGNKEKYCSHTHLPPLPVSSCQGFPDVDDVTVDGRNDAADFRETAA